jgi:hypothetical protein
MDPIEFFHPDCHGMLIDDKELSARIDPVEGEWAMQCPFHLVGIRSVTGSSNL